MSATAGPAITLSPEERDLGKGSPERDQPSPRLASPWRLSVQAFVDNRLAVVGLSVFVLIVLFCVLGPVVYHTNQISTNIVDAEQPPSFAHPLGTDEYGYDVLGRLMVGGRNSLYIGISAGVGGTLFGMVWGAIAGFLGGWVDALVMRVIDVVIAVPTLFLLVFVAAIVTPSPLTLILVIGFISWLVPARLVRAETLSLRTRDFVTAASGVGAGVGYIARKHLIPNALGTVVVNATFQVADSILFLAALSFLGLGLPAPATDWGSMLASGTQYAYSGYWWLVVFPGLMIVLTVVSINLVGDAARDAVDARLQRR